MPGRSTRNASQSTSFGNTDIREIVSDRRKAAADYLAAVVFLLRDSLPGLVLYPEIVNSAKQEIHRKLPLLP